MRLLFSFLFISISAISYSVNLPDSSKTKLDAGATISINSNGIASIPAFSLDKPAIMAGITLQKGRFSYDPLLAYGTNLKPWFIDNWLHYILIKKPSFELTTGFNISCFFSDIELSDDIILKGERYYALALTGKYKISAKNSLTFSYWNDRGQEKGTIKGHFLSLTGERSEISIGETLSLSAAVQLFYINYEGNNDGLFVSPFVSSSLRNLPFSLFFQATQVIDSNISPSPGFRWNIGLSYTL